MKKNVSLEKRKTFRHGDLRNALVTAGLEMARAGGPNAVVLREATRQAGVSPNAAYRHFANQSALLDGVRSACISQLAAAIEEEMKKCRPGRDPQAFARKSLRAVGMGYLGFAMKEPGMFRTAFSVPPPVHSPDPSQYGVDGPEPVSTSFAGIGSNARKRLAQSEKVAKERSILRGQQCTGWRFWYLKDRCTRCRRRWCWRWVSGWLPWWSVVSARCIMPPPLPLLQRQVRATFEPGR